jgi:hypothetical protein
VEMFYSKELPLAILSEMKHHFCGRHAVLEEDVQPLEPQKFDPYRLKLPLLHRHILDVSVFLRPTGCNGKRAHTTDGAIAYKLGSY